jgi:hypothetical protein
MLPNAVVTSADGLGTDVAVAAVDNHVAIVCTSAEIVESSGFVAQEDTTEASPDAVVASIFGQSVWSSFAKSAQKPSRPSDEMLAGTVGRSDGMATDGTPEAVAPEQAVSPMAAAATSPRIETRTDMGHLKRE